MKIYIGYAGCKVNQFEKNLLQERFLEKGYQISTDYKEADLIVFNTCCVTKRAEYDCRRMIRKISRENQNSKIIVTGCYAQKDKEELLSLPNVVDVIDNERKISIPEIIEGNKYDLLSGLNFEFKRIFKERARAFLKIQDGCDSFCSYCIVPYVRGKPKSMSEELVIKNLRNLKEEREIVLTGIHLGKWGIDRGKDLAYLMRLIKEESYPFRIRLSSLEPREITEELLKILRDMDNFCPHFHIPLQSGSDRILKLMKRDYDRKEFSNTIDIIRKIFPDAGIGIDVIVGFPGEDDKDFSETYHFIEGLSVDYLHVFSFSPREGTLAFRMEPKVKKEDILKRAKTLAKLDKEKRKSFEKRFLGKEVKCLFDRKEKGLNRFITREYLKVYSEKIEDHEEFSAKITDILPPKIEKTIF